MAPFRDAPRATLLLALLGLASLGKSCEPDPNAPVNLRVGTPPSRPCSLKIEWDPPDTTPPAGIQSYIVRRNGAVARVTSPFTHAFTDIDWLGFDDVPPEFRYSVGVLDGDGKEHATSAWFEVPDCPAPIPKPVLYVVVLLMNFPDHLAEPFTPDEILEVLYGDGDSVAARWEANSYGRQVLEPSLFVPSGWVRMPHPITDYCTVNPPGGPSSGCDIPAMQRDALLATGFYQYVSWLGIPVDRVLVVYTGFNETRASGMPLPDGGFIRGAVFTPTTALSRPTIVHEFGHASGLPHAGSIECPPRIFPPDIYDDESSAGCDFDPDGDPNDPLGFGARFDDHFNGFYKEMIGFLPADRIRMIPPGLTNPVRLYRLQDDIAGTQLLKVWTTHWTGTGYLLVQYAPGPLGNDVVQIRMKPGNRAMSLYGTRIASTAAAPYVDTVQRVRIDWVSSGIDAMGSYADLWIDIP